MENDASHLSKDIPSSAYIPTSPHPAVIKFEKVFWSARLIVLIPILASLLIGLSMFYVATLDTYYHMGSGLSGYADATASPIDETREGARTKIVTNVVEAIDGYLLGIVMLMFSFGLYELFIGRIEPAARSKQASRILVMRSLDDLKSRLGQVILLILIVKFFEGALAYDIKKMLDLLLLSVGIVLISFALYLTHKSSHESGHSEGECERHDSPIA